VSQPSADRSRTPVEPFFTALFSRNAAGVGWLTALLQAAPGGLERLGELATEPGWLVTPLAVRAVSGRLACFEQPAMPSRELLGWYIEHPSALTWYEDAAASAQARQLRRALVCDEPAGAQAKAQERALELLRTQSRLSAQWWRLEDPAHLDCILITDRLVVSIVAPRGGTPAPVTPWYPPRSELVRALEGAHQVAAHRAWATLLLSDTPVPGAGLDEIATQLAVGTPHLRPEERRAAQTAYLGNLTWRDACAAVDLPESVLTAVDRAA
jgi:hypothetical protein